MNLIGDQALRSIDRAPFDALRETTDPSDGFAKYLDIDYWIPKNVDRAIALGLAIGPPQRVLDLGCGLGYFVHVCKLMRHEAIGLDRPPTPTTIPGLVTRLLSVPVIDYAIKPFAALPDLGSFDAITAYMVTFNGHRRSVWGPSEWRFLIDDCISRLNTGGRIYLELNREPDGRCYTDEVKELFESYGAEINGHRVLIKQRHDIAVSAMPANR